MDTLKQKIGNLIPEHMVLLDCIEMASQSRVQIVVDGKTAVDLSTTTTIARNVRDSGLLDSIYPQGFQLEVTSPGVDAPLIHPVQFEKNIGKRVRLKMWGESELIQVEICHVSEKGFEGKLVNGHKDLFQYDEIESAKVEIKF
jgi:ribosome maturation factor RimP